MNRILDDDDVQRDGRRPNDPGYDPRTLYIPPEAWKSFTPFEKQASSIFKVDVAFLDNESFSSGRSVEIFQLQTVAPNREKD